MTCDTWYEGNILSNFQLSSSKGLGFMMLGISGSKKTRIQKPVNLQLYSKPLSWPRWVADTSHLGHYFCVDGTMAMDARLKHGSFIG